ncbi:MAG: SH3 domain-containing protein [Lewinellaceae bacterium]|nr:SH3 domain-containing protein [Lewinellaceae bacterium]
MISSILNVRSGPGVGNGQVAQLKYGNVVDILESSTDGWYRIAQGQWVIGKYIQIV